MKIVIAGGLNEADFLIRMFRKNHHQLIVINSDREYCEYLSIANEMGVFFGDPSKDYVLSDAGIHQADVLIALTNQDPDNLVICQLAKRVFGVKRCVSIVSNPKNVELFKKLGINHAISSTYLVAQSIERVSIIDSLVQTLSIEDEKIVLSEIVVDDTSHIIGKALKDLTFPVRFNVSCIFRHPTVIIPHGDTVFEAKDKLVLISTPEDQEPMIRFLQGKRYNG